MRQQRTSAQHTALAPWLPLLKLRFMAESRGLAPRFFRLAAETAIRRVRFRPRQAGDLLVGISSADRSMSVLLSSEPKVPWGKPTGLICSKSATSKLALQAWIFSLEQPMGAAVQVQVRAIADQRKQFADLFDPNRKQKI
jgi:hypothetical protein